jgi:hypothetical protein
LFLAVRRHDTQRHLNFIGRSVNTGKSSSGGLRLWCKPPEEFKNNVLSDISQGSPLRRTTLGYSSSTPSGFDLVARPDMSTGHFRIRTLF